MRTLGKIALIAALTLAPANLDGQNLSRPGYVEATRTIDSLVRELSEEGFETWQHFLSPSFERYKGISRLFCGSAETQAKEAVNKASEAERQIVFDNRLAHYKRVHGFDLLASMMSPFIKEHRQALATAESKYRIKKEIIAAVLGIESRFCTTDGSRTCFNIFPSLYLEGYERKDEPRWPQLQLKHLIVFAQRTKTDVFDYRSSYAGAVGWGQFLPSSLNTYFPGDDVHSIPQNIEAIAYYLSDWRNRTGKVEKALWHYNNSEFYVRFVLDLAERAKSTK
jgi:membrane-bound lytic murein transglycosylase B